MFKELQTDLNQSEKSIYEKFASKQDLQEINKKLKENSDAIKQGFKIFYIGSGIMITLGVVGGLIMWILNLISELQKLGVN
jgi:N-acetylmuramic acid 6-phosphate (MurNAc-6-P) etherase